ncbi:NUDIX domain-containing protein [Fulvivirgaceae bacterium PWU4]|uniref:NUDIX domain-containing protein n=1 Tax=Chryseosolibacter histidini TaxID=2782349 RepID=A0AAP2DNU0_9BACT|nr:NUDIX domain-containing protein [Chryseosolibacter histidini]MBT1698854.1 NUDIX domain-containing protein [Chryseosolibacter histidini]
MNFSPDKFFIGLMEFFSIILPGALLTYITQDAVINYFLGAVKRSSTEQTVIFLFSSYMAGHFIFLLGSLLDTHLYDVIRRGTLKAQVKKLVREQKLSSPLVRILASWLFKTDVDNAANSAFAIKERVLRPLKASSSINTFQWCKARLTLDKSPAITVVNRFEADSKFFRSFSVVLAMLVIWGLYTFNFTFSLICLGTMLLAFWRYADQRSKAVSQACWYIITLEGNNKTNAVANPAEPATTHAGGVVFRKNGEAVEYLVVESSTGGRWVLPKGHIEEGEREEEAATREVKEETGVWALIKCELGVSMFQYNCQDIKVRFYLMQYFRQGTLIDKTRKRQWLTFDKAMEILTFDENKTMLRKANEMRTAIPQT